MARFGLGGLLGASAAGAYGMQQYNQSGVSGVWSMLPSNWSIPTSQQGSEQSQILALQNDLRRLMADLARNNSARPTVVLAPSGRSGWTAILVPTAVGGVVLFVYCKVTGTSVWDLLFVSRSSLAQFRNTMQESLGKVWEEMKRQKDEVLKMVSGLSTKQHELGRKQDIMDERLRKVDEACSQLDCKASHTIEQMSKMDERVGRMDSRLQDVHSGVTAANHGIFMLVSAVSEVTQRIGLHNSKNAKALKQYAEGGPAWFGFGRSGAPADAALEPLPSVPEVQSLPAPNSPSRERLPSLPASGAGAGVSKLGTAQLGLRGVMDKGLGERGLGDSARSTPFSSASSSASFTAAPLQPFSLVVEGDGATAGPAGAPSAAARLESVYHATSFTGSR